MRKKIHIIAGARPNFMKVAPIVRALSGLNGASDHRIIHTGQHYDQDMSGVFFKELEIPLPYQHLEVGSGSHAVQTAKIMVSYEKVCFEDRPDVVIVVGDVNSTVACSLVAKKLNIAVAHVEAGLRSGDMTMPEEVNRIVTDAISGYLFVTERSGIVNLARDGKPSHKVFFVGHVMIDNLYYQLGKLENMDTGELTSTHIKQELGRYGMVTLHLTVIEGTNVLVGTNPDRVMKEAKRVLVGDGKAGQAPELWDGKVAQRIVQVLAEKFGI